MRKLLARSPTQCHYSENTVLVSLTYLLSVIVSFKCDVMKNYYRMKHVQPV